MTGLANWRSAAPTMSLPSGTLHGSQDVTVLSSTPAVAIHYTLTGVTPTDTDVNSINIDNRRMALNDHFCRFTQPSLGLTVQLTFCLLLLLIPRSSFADFSAICEPRPFKGSVKRVVQSEANADFESGAALRPLQVRYVTDVTSDGRTSTQLETYLEDPPPELLARSFSTIRQYDATGRMVSQTIKSDSVNTIATTSCEYDSERRLTRATVQSVNPMLRRTLTYRYGPSWRSEQFVTSAVSMLTTVTLDEQGRPLLQTYSDESTGELLDTKEFRYLPDGVDACSREVQGPSWCRRSVRDAHGNEIEARSDTGTLRVRYEYDQFGNWTKRVTSTTGLPTVGVWRKITYW